MQKLYIVTRADLPPAQQAVQAAHAALAFAVAHPAMTAAWQAASGHLVLCAAPDELALCWLMEEAARHPAAYWLGMPAFEGKTRPGILAVPFHEPDLDHALTAVALDPGARRLVTKYPLALQGESSCS